MRKKKKAIEHLEKEYSELNQSKVLSRSQSSKTFYISQDKVNKLFYQFFEKKNRKLHKLLIEKEKNIKSNCTFQPKTNKRIDSEISVHNSVYDKLNE